MTQELLQEIAEDVKSIRRELVALKDEVSGLRDIELEVHPAYVAKLKKIDAGPSKRFSSVEELRKEIES